MSTQPWDRDMAALRALLEDVAPPAPLPRAEECDMTQMHLDLFVSDELDGVDVRARHPQMWQHLQGCAACREDHDRLFALLAAEIEGRLPSLPPRPAASSAPSETPWRLEILPAAGRKWPSLQFIFTPAYLQRSLRPAAATGLRAADDLAAGRLLLSYLGAPTAGEVMVQLYAQPDPASPLTGALTLALIAAGEPMPVAAELTWGGRTWRVALGPDGEAIIGPVSAADLTPTAGDAAGGPAAFSLRLLY